MMDSSLTSGLRQWDMRRWLFVLLTGLSFSIGWGIRGQFGHEDGAMLAGGLGGMCVAILSGREDWRRRVAYFAFYGAVGIGFGGSMSYMKVQAYAHSSDTPSVLYGFGCLFVIGFLWAAPAGTGMALPAFLDREELTKFFVPISCIFGSWFVQDFVRSALRANTAAWVKFFGGYDTSAILAGLIVLGFFLLGRKYWGVGTTLVLWMACGWLAGDALFVRLLGLHMSPPRDDVWGACLGMVLGILACCLVKGWGGIGFATVSVGVLGGIGFTLGTAVKLLVMRSGYTANWHSVMEQTQGLFLGLAIAWTFATLVKRAPLVSEGAKVRRWTEAYCVVFVLWVVTYLNFRTSPDEWVGEVKDLQAKLYGISIASKWLPERGVLGWIDIAALVGGLALVALLAMHLKRPLAVFPETWLGKGQLFYVVFLWAMVAMNLILVIPRFTPLRLVTEWFIALNATACTVLMIFGGLPGPKPGSEDAPDRGYAGVIRKVVLVGVLGGVIAPLVGTGVKLVCWGKNPAGVRFTDPIRFGPKNTNTER